MNNSYNPMKELLNGGVIGIITNKKTKKMKRYILLIFCILFYLLLIGLCFVNGINSFITNKTLFIILMILGIILTIDFYRFFHEIEKSTKKAK